MWTYLALPGQVVCLEAAPVEGDQEVRAAVSVCQRELRIAHLLAGRLWSQLCVSADSLGRVGMGSGGLTPRHFNCFVVCHFGRCNRWWT